MSEDKVVKLIKVAELHPVMEPQVFKEPKEMVVWNNDDPKICKAIEILPNGKIICEGHIWYNHGAFIPKKPAPRRATNRELAKWLAQGNGEYTEGIEFSGKGPFTKTTSYYDASLSNNAVNDVINVRKWEDTEWHEPDVEYMGIEVNDEK